jgi:hypothetical protein
MMRRASADAKTGDHTPKDVIIPIKASGAINSTHGSDKRGTVTGYKMHQNSARLVPARLLTTMTVVTGQNPSAHACARMRTSGMDVPWCARMRMRTARVRIPCPLPLGPCRMNAALMPVPGRFDHGPVTGI